MSSLRHSIAFRLFVVTFAAIVLFVGVLLLVLAGGFSSFYEQRQKKDIAADLNDIRDRYADYLQSPLPSLSPDKQEISPFPPFFNKFESEYSASLAVVVIQGNSMKIMFSDGSDSAGVYGQSSLFIGESGSGGSSEPELPKLSPPVQIIGKDGGTSVYVMPKLPNVELAEQLRTALEEWRQNLPDYDEVMKEGKTLVYRGSTVSKSAGAAIGGTDAQRGAQLIAVAPITRSHHGSVTTAKPNPVSVDGEVLFAVSSLQPVNHASSVFKDMSLYVFAVAFVFVGLLAVGFAVLVTRPLRRLNGIAGRLARLDFSARSGWKRKDEIGDLSRTFDFLADNLQGTLAELTSANEKLRRDIENEKRLEKLRREFVAGVSHELKTPLSLIGGYAEGLRDNIGSGVKREQYAEVILEETERMAAIVGDMLDLSHLESGHYSLKLEAVDVAELLSEAADRAAALSEGKAVRVSVSLPAADEGRLLTAAADRFRIGQVLTNLVTNAVRHTPAGGALELSADQAGDGGDWVIAVHNEGEPIPKEEMPRIWGQFYRIDRARTRDGGGTGIGLAIVRQILELHDSRYGVRNERGGVTFYFTLRAAGAER